MRGALRTPGPPLRAVLIAAVALAAGAGARTSATPVRAAASADVTVTIDAAHRGRPVPRRFLGLSFEARDLPTVARLARAGDLAALLRSIGPGVLRFGGNSVDATTAWTDGPRPPRWARVAITPADLDGIAALARETGWSVLLAVTLGHPDAPAAAREVAAARARLGAMLAGVEIGNEPDQYVKKRLRRRPWGYSRYRAQVASYRAAIAAAAPGVTLAGPDLADAHPSRWLASYAARERPAILTAHFYPLIRCGGAKPTIAQLMSPALHLSEQRVLARLAALARARRRPLRVGETNNVACSGQPGVSDRYASALWALDYLVRAVGAGVSGVNFHGFVRECRTYTPLCAPTGRDVAAGRVGAAPEWYALLAARVIAGARPLRVRTAPAGSELVTLALRTPGGGIDVLALDESSRPLKVALVPPRGLDTARVTRLTGPSLGARAGVTLGGSGVAPDGSWRPADVARSSRRGSAPLLIALGAHSAAVVAITR